MKTIIIPTDFSPNSINAIKYAIELNKSFNADIILFHSFLVPVDTSNLLMTSPDEEEIRKISMNTLRKIKNESIKENILLKSEIDLHVSSGFMDYELINFAEKRKADLVIMGTKGASGLKEKFMGSNTTNILEKINCPVIVVPEEARYKEIKKIVFTTNFSENDFEHIQSVIEFAKHFNAEIIILHISGSGNISIPYQFNEIETFSHSLKESSRYDNISFKLLDNNNIEEGVAFYLDEIKADLIVMTKRHRSFFQKIFDKSLTRKMAMHTHTPLLVYHMVS